MVKPAPPPASSSTRGPAAASVAPASEEVVKARDEAILDALKLRPWTTDALITVLPIELDQTALQREVALKSALMRLNVRKQIKQVDGKWVLA